MKLNKKTTNAIFLFAIFIGMFGFVFVGKVQALTISPARLEISGDPGTTVTKEVTLSTDGKSAETYYVSYANFEAQGETGTPRFVEPKSDLGTWMNAGESVTVIAGQPKTIPITIKIPKDAYAGGHFAVVFFGTSPNTKNGGQVSIGAKMGTLVLLSVTGDVLEAGGLADFKTKNNKLFYNTLPVSFQYRFKNDGNDRVKPQGNITIHNLVYFPVAKVDANSVFGNILPHSTRLFDVDWIKYEAPVDESVSSSFISSFFNTVHYQWKNFAVGPYIANLDLVYGVSKTHYNKYAFFFVFPWQLMIIILIVLIVLFFGLKNLIKRYNNYIIKKARAGLQTPNDARHD